MKVALSGAVFLLVLTPTAHAAPPNTYIDRVYDADTGDSLIDEDGSGAENVRADFHGDGIAAERIRFRCRVDAQAYVTCTSPWQRAVSVGNHTLTVQAYNVRTGERDLHLRGHDSVGHELSGRVRGHEPGLADPVDPAVRLFAHGRSRSRGSMRSWNRSAPGRLRAFEPAPRPLSRPRGAAGTG